EDPLALAAGLLDHGVALEDGVGVGRPLGGVGGLLLGGRGTGGDRREGAGDLGDDVLDEGLLGVLDLRGEGVGGVDRLVAGRVGVVTGETGVVVGLALRGAVLVGGAARQVGSPDLQGRGAVGGVLRGRAGAVGRIGDGVTGLVGPALGSEHVSSS